MRKLFTILSLLIVASMVLAACGGAAPATTEPAAPEPAAPEPAAPEPAETDEPEPATSGFTSADPSTLVVATIGEPDLLDPALDYETAGGEVLQNVYETLVTYSGNSLSDFEPLLAESWELSEDGQTYSFTVKQGVTYHNGNEFKASDFAYSFVRGMLQGGGSSPQFLIIEPFYGVGMTDISEVVEAAQVFGLEAIADGVSEAEMAELPYVLYDDVEAMKAVDPAILAGVCEDLYSKFQSDDAAGTISMNLALPWAPFIATIAGYWSSAMDPAWVAEQGGWDGSCDTWADYYAMQPENNPIYDTTNGTGPFMLDHWTAGEEVVLVRNDNYWREPAQLERVVIQTVDEWSTRFAMMQAGDADFAVVPVANRSQMDALVGEDCPWDNDAQDYTCTVVDDSLPFRRTIGRSTNTRSDIFFNFNVGNPDGSNTYLGSGELDGNGIPADFFGDVHVRKAFNYCFDWDTYIGDIFNGEAIQSTSLVIEDMPGWNETDPVYNYDPAKCEEEFKLADVDKDGIPAGEDPEGDIWTTGFRFSSTYNQGNDTRQTLAEMVSQNVNSVNELFIVEVVGLPWPAYLRSINARLAPLFYVGWHEDIHDPHNWYVPYLVSFYAQRQSIDPEIKASFVPLINAGALETDADARHTIYTELNQMVYDAAPGIIGVLGTTHGFRQRWVQGEGYNQNYSNLYYYPMWKE
jgi:peptide/nickel transport system substrate-binding protein